jgi:hypothetical protein
MSGMRTLKAAAEAAALALVVMIDALDPRELGEQRTAMQVGIHLAPRRTGGVQRHLDRGAGVLDNSPCTPRAENSASSKVRAASDSTCFRVCGSSLNSSK